MKNLLYFLLACLIILSCEDNEELGFEDFYDSYLINDVFINVDRIIFFEGDPPVAFTAEAFDETENQISNFDFVVIINETDTLEGKTFSPTETGRYIAHAVANNVESTRIAIDYINPSDIDNLKLHYQGYQYLTTEPWSVTGDFILTTTFPDRAVDVEITRSNIPLTISDGRITSQKEGLQFSEPGTFQVYVDFNGIKTQPIDIIVREAKTYETINIPVVFHYVNQNPSVDQIEKAIASYNNVFNNQNIVLNPDNRLSQWDNPSWVNAGMAFSLVPMSENQNLESNGINLISTPDPIETKEAFDLIARNNLFDPNKYLNIFVTEDINNSISVRPIVEGPAPVIQGISNVETATSREPYILNIGEPYNSFTMGAFWGLLQTQGCREDFAADTYSFNLEQQGTSGFASYADGGGPDPYATSNCRTGGFTDNWRNDWDTRICLARSENYSFNIDLNIEAVFTQIALDCRSNNPAFPSFFYINNIMDRNEPDNYKKGGTTEYGIDRFRTIITFDQRERMRAVIQGAKYRPTDRNK